MNSNFDKKISEVLSKVSLFEGVSTHDNNIVVNAKNLNNYLFVSLLAQMIDNGECEIKISPNKINYCLELLNLKNN